MQSNRKAESSTIGLLAGIKGGDESAIRHIWEEYFESLVGVARVRLRHVPRSVADEEDVAIHAMNAFLMGARKNRFPGLANRQDLSRILVQITVRTASNQSDMVLAQKRGTGSIEGGSELDSESCHEHLDRSDELLDELDDDNLRLIARRRAEGYTNAEIAAEFQCAERTIERRLARIRILWKQRRTAPHCAARPLHVFSHLD